MSKPSKPGARSLRRYCTPQKQPVAEARPVREKLPKLPARNGLLNSLRNQAANVHFNDETPAWAHAGFLSWCLLYRHQFHPMPTPFASEDLIQVHRPNKDFHGWVGRFLDYGSDPSLAYVSFRKPKKGEAGPMLTPPELKTFRKREHATIRLFPVAHLTKYTPTV